MAKNFETQGIIHSIGATAEFGSNGFTKREFVIKVTGEGENPTYPNYAAFELIKDKCALMDEYKQGEEIKVQFNITGRLWSGNGKPEKCFTTLQAWKVDSLKGSATPSHSAPASNNFASNNFIDDDVPF